MISWPLSSRAAVLEELNSFKPRTIILYYDLHDHNYIDFLDHLGYVKNNRNIFLNTKYY